ncbi:MAG: GspH/FimT family pseudopilin [Gammaproteobacteria bacterium]
MTSFSSLSLKHKQGFTLLELLIVLAIIVLGFSVVAFNVSAGKGVMEHKAAVRDIVSALRYARGQALMFHQEKTVSFDLAKNSYTVSGRDKEYTIPAAIDVTIVTAQSELTGQGQGSFRFYPDGSSSGGRLLLERGSRAIQIDISWLTGHVKVENASGD